MPFNMFPYSDLQTLNLDWLLHLVKQLTAAVEELQREIGQGGSGGVVSVNGRTGVVVLTAGDVGALPSSTQIPTRTSQLNNDSDFQTGAQVQSAIAAAAELPSVSASDNGKFLRVVSGAWAATSVPSAESNSFGGGA